MPTYDLTCRDCGTRFERFFMRLLRQSDLVCPECGSTRVDRGIGGGMLGSGTKSAVRAPDRACRPSGGFT